MPLIVGWFRARYGTPCVDALMTYAADSGPFAPFSKMGCSPEVFWKFMAVRGYSTQLAEGSQLLLASRCSSADLERAFSTCGFVYGKFRGRMGAVKAGHLAFVMRQLHGNTHLEEDPDVESHTNALWLVTACVAHNPLHVSVVHCIAFSHVDSPGFAPQVGLGFKF